MNFKNTLLAVIVLFTFNIANSQEKKFVVHTVAFYNLENFYDTINDPNSRDDEWVYTSKYYKKKVDNIAKVVSQIGSDENQNLPTIVGFAEVEHISVLEDLIKNPLLIKGDYGIVHYESPDKRGIDCALIYQKKHFKLTSSSNIPLMIYEKDTKKVKNESLDTLNINKVTKRIYTRDQILVSGFLDGEEFNFIVNHWPSRRGGEAISRPLRELAAALNVKIIDSLQKNNPDAKVISMGDLNDGPFDNSLKKVLKAKGKKEEVKPLGIYNPSEKMAKNGNASLFYRDAGDIFDQIFMTEPLIRKDYSSYRYWKAGIYRKEFMIQKTGQYKGYPLRNNLQEPGYSDHLPAYIYLIKEVN